MSVSGVSSGLVVNSGARFCVCNESRLSRRLSAMHRVCVFKAFEDHLRGTAVSPLLCACLL